MKRGDFMSRIDPKSPLNEETGRENLERENQGRLVEEQEIDSYFHDDSVIIILRDNFIIIYFITDIKECFFYEVK